MIEEQLTPLGTYIALRTPSHQTEFEVCVRPNKTSGRRGRRGRRRKNRTNLPKRLFPALAFFQQSMWGVRSGAKNSMEQVKSSQVSQSPVIQFNRGTFACLAVTLCSVQSESNRKGIWVEVARTFAPRQRGSDNPDADCGTGTE